MKIWIKNVERTGEEYAQITLTREEVLEFCKPGQGAETCIWLAAGGQGLECLYYAKNIGRNLYGESLEDRLKAGKTVAKRDGCEMIRDSCEMTKRVLDNVGK